MEARQDFTPQQKAYGGAIVTLGHDGGLEIRRGLVRREDRRPLDAAAREHGGVSVMGGRETAVAGRKSDGLSERALQQLAAAETAALRAAMVGNPRVALAMLLSQLTQSEVEGGTCSVRTGTVPFNPELASLDTDESEGEALESLLALDTPALIERIVATVAKVTTVDVSAKRALSRNETAMAALGIDMAQHFTPTVEWFGLISKAQILAAIQSANPAAKVAELEKLKKGDLCEVAARECADWTPEQLYRCPIPVADEVEAEDAPVKPRRARAAKKGTAKSTAKVSAKVKGKTTKGASKGASQR
jgi:ParB family chromosome partitioning protein